MADSIKLRPHHGLCIQHFIGKGYSDEFVGNMRRVVETLKANPDVAITFTDETDDVLCGSCPHRGDGVCLSGQKPSDYDHRCLALTGFHIGESTTWRAYAKRVREKILGAGLLKSTCSGCQWLDICDNINC